MYFEFDMIVFYGRKAHASFWAFRYLLAHKDTNKIPGSSRVHVVPPLYKRQQSKKKCRRLWLLHQRLGW